jgi:hypothetical protein
MITLYLFGVSSAIAAALPLSNHGEGALLNNVSDYDWWYGCSPTSAGMMMAYYDINGYDGLLYDNLVPGGQAELSTFPSTPGQWDYLAQAAIASPGHVSDFYVSGYDRSGDDVRGTRHDFDSLADFMGTSQDAAGNTNGWTTFWFYNNGSPLYAADIYVEGAYYYESDGMFGMWEYFNYAGYGNRTPDSSFFSQYVDSHIGSNGFSFADYMAEINEGRLVMIHVDEHSMLGYGYDNNSNTIYLYDTWKPGPHTMTWGGYYNGLRLYGVTCFTPTGGHVPVPEPSTMLLLCSGLIALAEFWRKPFLYYSGDPGDGRIAETEQIQGDHRLCKGLFYHLWV